jgi:alanine racemase
MRETNNSNDTINFTPGRLEIDLDAIEQNYRTLVEKAAPAVVGSVVKADAYGLGAVKIVPALKRAGCRHFFVAHLQEAAELLDLLGDDCRLYVLNGLLPGSEKRCADLGIVPVLNSLDQLQNWNKLAVSHDIELPAVLQVDSGMSRLGFSQDEWATLVGSPDLMSNLSVEFIVSHLACADEPDHPANASQLQTFKIASASFPKASICFANSGGIFLDATYHGAYVRSGIALWGGAPNNLENPMARVVSLKVAVIQTRTIPQGTSVGYGASFTAAQDIRLATISAGYADGLPRSFSDRGKVWFDGISLPIVGRVSMDTSTVDVSALPADALCLGSYVELIGPHQSLEDFAQDAQTISYEILTRLGRRYERIYQQSFRD